MNTPPLDGYSAKARGCDLSRPRIRHAAVLDVGADPDEEITKLVLRACDRSLLGAEDRRAHRDLYTADEEVPVDLRHRTKAASPNV